MEDFLERKKSTLPDWVTFPEPSVKTVYRIIDKGEYFAVEGADGLAFALPSEAYDYITGVLNGNVVFEIVDLARVSSSPKLSIDGFFFEIPKEGEETSRLLISYNEYSKKNLLQEEYSDFLELHENYSATPNNWFLAYCWLKSHPVFWHTIKTHSDMWISDEGLEHVYPSVYQEDGKTIVLLESGPYVDNYTQHTIDMSLTAWGETFEEAYIGLAKQVNKHYDIEGVERVGVEPTKTFKGKNWLSSL